MRFARICGHTVWLEPLSDNGVIVDLGANHGDFSQRIQTMLNCRPYCIEPNPLLFKELSEKHGARAFNFAIAARPGRVDFRVTENDQASTMFSPQVSCTESVIRCEAVTLQDLIAVTGLTHIDLVKMDIEGAELEVLGTADDSTLSIIDQLTVEFHEAYGIGTEEQVRETINRLDRMGFDCFTGSFTCYDDVLFVNRRRLRVTSGWRVRARTWSIVDAVHRRARRAMAW